MSAAAPEPIKRAFSFCRSHSSMRPAIIEDNGTHRSATNDAPDRFNDQT
jgi:hypothetical protein